MLYAPEFLMPEFKSNVADCRNLMSCVTNAGSACAGHFIENNLPKDFKGEWIRIDIAQFPKPQALGALGSTFGRQA